MINYLNKSLGFFNLFIKCVLKENLINKIKICNIFQFIFLCKKKV